MSKHKSSRSASRKKRRKSRSSRKAAAPGLRRARESTGTGRPAVENRGPIAVKSTVEFERYLTEPEPLVVDFWAPWCAPCRLMAPVFERVARQFAGKVHFLKVNTEMTPELSRSFGIRSIPTVLALDGAEVIDAHVGVLNDSGLAKMAQRVLDRATGVTLGMKVKRLFGVGKKDDSAAE